MRAYPATATLAALILGFACRAQPATTISRVDLVGTYQVERAGRNAGHLWSVRSTLTLIEPDTYFLDHIIRNDGEEEDESETGKFRIEGDLLVLRSEKNQTTDLRIRGDSLVAKLDWPGRWFVRWVGGAPVFVRREPKR